MCACVCTVAECVCPVSVYPLHVSLCFCLHVVLCSVLHGVYIMHLLLYKTYDMLPIIRMTLYLCK